MKSTCPLPLWAKESNEKRLKRHNCVSNFDWVGVREVFPIVVTFDFQPKE